MCGREPLPGRRSIVAGERKGFAAGKSRLEIVFEGRGRVGALDYNQIIVLPLEAGG